MLVVAIVGQSYPIIVLLPRLWLLDVLVGGSWPAPSWAIVAAVVVVAELGNSSSSGGQRWAIVAVVVMVARVGK